MMLYEAKVVVPADAIADLENALSDLASAVLTRAIETGADKGKWEVQALFEHKPDLSVLRRILPGARVVPLPDKDWLRECYRSFKPLTIGRFFIYGSHVHEEVPAGLIPLKIDAATAFGTGEHQTTRGCLQALDDLDVAPDKVLDVGTGSGILAMAYAKRFRRPADATDIDAESVRVAAENAAANGAGDLVRVWQSAGYDAVPGTYDLIFCNILARPLTDMAADLAARLNPGGRAILSGFLTRQAASVLRAHERAGLAFVRRYRVKGWSTLVVQKPKH
ncbi:MAG: 50S ribosomal protein L11 methyltransferase [Alphaproteobacteria bacterium]|nr:50S ribosomal protein L11 methyltransferase [Alphaproteobacteria bacterium]